MNTHLANRTTQTSPRKRRLHKAAQTLLVAATAAVFFGGPAKAAVPMPIEITSIGAYYSGYDTFEGDSHSMLVNTNVNYDTVDWYVNDSFVRKSDGPSRTSVFSHNYSGLGSTTGAPVVVKAVAADANGNTDTDQATINVWTKSETVAITSQTNDQTFVGAATTDVAVQTDVGFYRVDWSIDGGTPISDNGPGLTSQITYDFSTVPYGNTVTFTATPYGVNANGEAVAGNAATIKIRVVEPISSVTVYCPDNVVAGEQFTLSASADAPFHTIRWFVGGSDAHVREVVSDNYGDRYAYASEKYAFESGSGSDAVSGKEYTVRAVAYAVDPDTLPADHLPPSSTELTSWKDIKTDTSTPPVSPFVSDEKSIFVHEGKKKILRDTFVTINHFNVKMSDNRKSALVDISFTAGIDYYNDLEGADANIYAFVLACKRRRNRWGQLMRPEPVKDSFDVFHAPNNVEGEKWLLPLALRYDGSASRIFELRDAVFVEGAEELPNFYYAYASAKVNQQPKPKEWKFTLEGIGIDGAADRDDDHQTESREFSKEWSDGWNSP